MRTISSMMARVSSSKATTWSESQRTGRDTWSSSLSLKVSMEDSLALTTSVGWKWPVSKVTRTFGRLMA